MVGASLTKRHVQFASKFAIAASIATAALLFASLTSCAKKAALPQVTLAELPSLEQLLKIVTPSDGARTADGNFVFVNWKTGVDQLYITTPEGEKQLTSFPDGISGYRISPDRTRALILEASKGNEQYNIHLLDFKSGIITPILVHPNVRYDDPVWAPDGKGFIYSANTPSPKDFYIYYYDLEKRMPHLEIESEGYNWPTAFSPDGRYFAYLEYRAVNDTDGYVKELGVQGSGRPIYLSKGNAGFYPLGFTADGELVVETNHGYEHTYPALVSIRDRKIKPIEKRKWSLEGIKTSTSGKTLAYVYNEDGASELVIMTYKGNKRRTPKLPAGMIRLNDVGDDFIVFTHTSGANPKTVYAWWPARKELKKVALPDLNGVEPSFFVEPKLVRVKSSDGLDIPVYIYEPVGRERPYPFLVYAHGGPEAQFRPRFSRLFTYLLINGFGVCAPNVRGSTGYGKAYAQADNYRNRMKSVRDLRDVTEWLISKGYAEKGRLAVYGGSYGGFMVMASITEYPDLFQAAVSGFGIVDFVNFLEHTKPYRRRLREAEYGPLSDREFLRSVSPIHKLDRIRTPLFLVHGRNDPRVPVSESEHIYKTLKDMGHEVEILIFEDEGHGIAKLSNRLIYYPQMVEFLKKHLGEE